MKVDINSDRSENVKYDYPDFPIYVRRALLSAYPNYAADSHWHDDIELIAILSGQMQYNVNGTVVTLNAGEGILVNARQLHFGFSATKTECDFICILFHPVLLCASKMFEIQFVEPFLNADMPFIHILQNVHWQKEMFRYVCEICNNKDKETSPLYSQGFIYLLWKEIAENCDFTAESQKVSDTKLVTLKKMMSYIHENYKEKITLQDISMAGHISKRTCGNIFAEYLNHTPIGYLTDYRLRKSIELMKDTDMTILEISFAVGFSGASYYAETFRKYFGKSPAEYRKICNKKKYNSFEKKSL